MIWFTKFSWTIKSKIESQFHYLGNLLDENVNKKCSRIEIIFFRFLDKFFDSGCLASIIEDSNSDFAKTILKQIQIEISGCKDIYKLIDGISVICQFIQVQVDFDVII